MGYVQSHPWSGEEPPHLGRDPESFVPIPSPSESDHYFLFDAATKMKGKGVGEALLQVVLQAAKEAGMKQVRLVAVQGAETYWSRFGFEKVRKLPEEDGYGEAYYMRLMLEDPGEEGGGAGAAE